MSTQTSNSAFPTHIPATNPPATNPPATSPPATNAPQRILSINEDELSRIILDVHDGPVQYLFTALSLLTSIRDETAQSLPDSDIAPRLAQVGMLLESSLYEIKTFMGTFRPPEFRKRSLVSILEGLILQHEEWTNARVEFEMDSIPDVVPLALKIAFYRILQESLANAYRHAGVDQLWVRLWAEDGCICLEVEDDGCGFEPPDVTGQTDGQMDGQVDEHVKHIGLRGMADRIGLLGGTIEINSAPDKGTRILVKAPTHG